MDRKQLSKKERAEIYSWVVDTYTRKERITDPEILDGLQAPTLVSRFVGHPFDQNTREYERENFEGGLESEPPQSSIIPAHSRGEQRRL